MNKRWTDILLTLAVGLGFPAVLFSLISNADPGNVQENTTVSTQEETLLQTEQTQARQSSFITVLMEDGSIQNLEMDTYITGVVLREMPAQFELEALKAQAVVARTYAMRRAGSGGKHTGAAICTSSACCQGYCSVEEYLLAGGTQEEVDKISQAVKQTTTQVLTYEGELIEATYFSCSGGMTEDAVAVWGTDIPYLRSTQSPGEEAASHYTDTVYYTTPEFARLLGIADEAIWVGDTSYTSGGGVDSISICGERFTGLQIRKLLNLRSTAFTLTVSGSVITVTTKGYGHRVGMSQYGADAMAVQGSTYVEILAHYYQGTTLVEY